MFNKKSLYFMILMFFLISMVSASTINIGDYTVSIEQDECFNIPLGCDNCTFMNVTITYPNGTIIVSNGSATTLNGYHYNYSFCNTSTLGRYWITYHYDDGGYLTTDQDWVYVTPNGFNIQEGNSILYLGVLFLIFLMLIVSLFATFNVENYIGKFALYWVTHLLIILFSFSVWKVTEGFLIGFIGLAGIFKIIFYFSIFSVFPMIILSIAWIIYIHTFNEHFQKLIDKGEDTETAFKMASKKRGGWFYGQR